MLFPKPTHRKKSERRRDEQREYSRQRDEYLALNPYCQLRVTQRCTPAAPQLANQIHHRQGREGKLLLDKSKWLSSCHTCHTWAHRHPVRAYLIGLLLRRNRPRP